MTAAAPELPGTPGWTAELRLGFVRRSGRTVLAERRRSGPLAVQRPFYPEGEVCHVYLLHPPGGVVGGDRLTVEVEVHDGARALLTTPGATKFYRSGGRQARQLQRIVVRPGATLEWLPQENIFFDGADAALVTEVDLHGDARLLLWEIHCLGRPVIAEGFDAGYVDGRLSIRRDGVPLLLDRLRTGGSNWKRLALAAGHAVVASLVVGPAGDDELAACRALQPPAGLRIGATLADGLLVIRCLTDSTEKARTLFAQIRDTLRPATLGYPPGTPRIWAT